MELVLCGGTQLHRECTNCGNVSLRVLFSQDTAIATGISFAFHVAAPHKPIRESQAYQLTGVEELNCRLEMTLRWCETLHRLPSKEQAHVDQSKKYFHYMC